MTCTAIFLTLLRRFLGGVLVMSCAIPLSACAQRPTSPNADTLSIVAPTVLVMSGLRSEQRGDPEGALARYRDALAAARAVYGDDHPNVAFAHAAVGIWHARFGTPEEARHHLRESRQIDEAHGRPFANLAETRLPANGTEPVAVVLSRLRLQRDLALCVLEGGCSLARVLGLAEAFGEVVR